MPETRAAVDFFATAAGAEYVADPYPWLRELRAAGPVVPTEAGFWLVPRYRDVVAGLRDPRLSCELGRLPAYADYFQARGIDDRFPPPLNALDAPDHTRLRAAMSKEFVPQAVDRMIPTIDRAARSVVDSLPDEGEIDLVSTVSYPVPIAIIGALFDLPDEDLPTLARWSRAFGSASDPDVLLGPAQVTAAADATREAGEYFGRLVGRRRRGGDDLLARWLAGSRAERTLTVAETLVNGVFLLMVGHHNTVSLISNGMLALLRAPRQLDRLRSDPSLMDSAVHELLRYDSPVQTATRATVEPYEVDGVVIPSGHPILFLLGSANRDETTFPSPDRLDLARPDANRNLGFGRGAHACVGGYMARLETAATLRALLARYRTIEIAGEPVRQIPSMSLRGLAAFPIRVAR
ncbi:cytochrome P450 [Actinokineospora enzanensis]|uniref:cytochrome P450 n=1 Tax=Actinokineospora enzanensis TaxID=155975 RepID=UPI000381699A|nr:cytochrome P450 [Actinokineospora enzanensis]